MGKCTHAREAAKISIPVMLYKKNRRPTYTHPSPKIGTLRATYTQATGSDGNP
jgi:hypothetical protein